MNYAQKKKIDINAKNSKKQSAIAIAKDDPEVVKLLMKNCNVRVLIQYAASLLDFLDFLVFEPFQMIEIKDRQRTKNVALLIALASYNQRKVSTFQLPRRLQWSLIRLDDTKKLKLPKSLFLKPGSVQ